MREYLQDRKVLLDLNAIALDDLDGRYLIE